MRQKTLFGYAERGSDGRYYLLLTDRLSGSTCIEVIATPPTPAEPKWKLGRFRVNGKFASGTVTCLDSCRQPRGLRYVAVRIGRS